MDPSRTDRFLEEALAPVPPPAGLRDRVLAAAPRSSRPRAAVLRLLVPYAAGILTVLAVRALPSRSAEPPPAHVSFDSIADRLPPPPPAPAALPSAALPSDAPDPAPAPTPLPRIS